MTKILFTFDDFSLNALITGALPRTTMSHDQNFFQLARAALSEGLEVYFTSIDNYLQGRDVFKFDKIYPRLMISDFRASVEKVKPDIVVSNHIHIFAFGQTPYAKKVAIHPALYFVEMPQLYDAEQTRTQIIAARHHVDFICVQNSRMKEVVAAFYGWLAGWSDHDRILVNPLGIVPEEELKVENRIAARMAMKLGDQEVVIVNGGGIWRWTGFNDFLRGYISAVRNGADNLVLVLTGFKQEENLDHIAYINETKEILSKNADICGNRFAVDGDAAKKIRIHVEDDWNTASNRLPTLYASGDYGLNVNQNGLENWQAQRVRCLDYTKRGLPLLTTCGDYFSDHVFPGGSVTIPSTSEEDVRAVLMRISKDPEVTKAAKIAALGTYKAIIKNDSMRQTLLAILRQAKRTPADGRESVLDALWMKERPRIVKDSAERIRLSLGL